MATDVTLASGNAHSKMKTLLPALKIIAARLWAMLARQFEAESRTEQAIETLHDPFADLDKREWAERYLCHMEGADYRRYCEGRRWQS